MILAVNIVEFYRNVLSFRLNIANCLRPLFKSRLKGRVSNFDPKTLKYYSVMILRKLRYQSYPMVASICEYSLYDS